jgi:hypothetical protein
MADAGQMMFIDGPPFDAKEDARRYDALANSPSPPSPRPSDTPSTSPSPDADGELDSPIARQRNAAKTKDTPCFLA